MLAGIKSVLQEPKWRTWLFVFFTLLLYYTRTRPPDNIHDIKTIYNYGFLASGKTGVVVVEFTDPSEPTEVTIFNTYGFANSLDLSGNLLYVADGPDGLKILSLETLSDNRELTQVGSKPTPGDALDVAVRGDYVFVIDSKEDLIIYQIAPNATSFPEINRIDINGKAKRIEISGNRAYVSNDKDRLSVFDISDPKALVEIGAIDLQAEINSFLVVDNNVYVAADDRGLVILNVSGLPEIVLEAEVRDVRDAYDVSLRGTSAYVASGNRGYYVLDISDFRAITILGHDASLDDASQIQAKDDYVYIADDRNGLKAFESPVWFDFAKLETASSRGLYEKVAVKGNYAYVAAGESGLKVVNVTSLSAPVSVSFDDGVNDYATAVDIRGDYLYVTYRSQGLKEYNIVENPEVPTSEGVESSIPGEANDVTVKGMIAYVAGGSGGFHAVDFSNLANPQIHSVKTPGTAQGVFVLSDYAYVADGGAGFQVISISNPQNPILVQSIDTPGEAVAIQVSKQINSAGEERTYAFVADGSAGLFIADISDLSNPVLVATYETSSFVNDVFVKDQTAYLAEREEGLLAIDISKIDAPQLIGSQNTPGQAKGLFFREDEFIFVADYDRGLRIIDVIEPSSPQEIGYLDIPRVVRALIAQKPYGFMVDGKYGMWVLDMSDSIAPVPISHYPTPGDALNVTVLGSYAFIADGRSGIQVVNIANPQIPQFAGEYRNIDNALDVAIQGSFAYVISEGQKLYVLNLTDLSNIQEESVFRTAGNALDIGVSGRYAYIVEGDKGLEIVNIEDPQFLTGVVFAEDLSLRDSRAVLVLGYRNHIFVADGIYGLKTINIQNPTNPVLTYSYPIENGVATSITADQNYVFMAVDQKNVFAFDIFNVNKIAFVGSYEAVIEQDGGQNQIPYLTGSIAVLSETASGAKRYITYVTADEKGLQIFRLDGKAAITERGMYESVGEANLKQVLRSLPAIVVGLMTGNPDIVQVKVWVRLAYILFGTILFFFLAGLWLILLSQFVLPVQTMDESLKAVSRLVTSLMGEHGPVIFIKEGKIVHRPDELDRRGPGVARVDLNSAIVLEKRSLMNPQYRQQYRRDVSRKKRRGKRMPHARVEGPGVVFIEPYESIHGVADLRPQYRIRPGVRAYTRDGIEIECPVWILFTLGQPPEVLDVTYEGERRAENLRVVNFDTKDIPARESIRQLDAENAKFYARYQAVRRFFQKTRELSSRFILEDPDSSSEQSHSQYQQIISDLNQDSANWGIADVEQIQEFIRELENQFAAIDLKTQQDRLLLVNNIKHLADSLLREVMIDFYDNIYQGKKQRGLVVKQLSAELDPEDQEEIHRYIQTKTVSRYFSNVKSLASKLDCDDHSLENIRTFSIKIRQLATRWEILARDEVRRFVDGVDALVMEIDCTNPSEVQWFGYQACVLSDELVTPKTVDYYEYIYPTLVENYQVGLRELMSTRGLSRFARQAMADISNISVMEDDVRLYSLNALDLWRSVRPEFEDLLSRLESDPENEVEIELLQISIAKFDHITQSLVRTDFPYSYAYSTIAELRHHFLDLQEIAPRITLREELRTLEYLKLFSIRRTIRDIQQSLLELRGFGKLEFERYLDLIRLYDYVQSVSKYVSAFRQVNGEGRTGGMNLSTCVANIKRESQTLERISSKSFKRPVRRLMKWTHALNDKDPAYLFYFDRQVKDLWEKIEIADQLAILRALRRGKKQVAHIQQYIRKFTIQSKSLSDVGEITKYRNSLDQILLILEKCEFASKPLKPGNDAGEKVRFGPFMFVRKRVLAAIYSKALDIDQEGEYMPWTNLPVHAAAQTFRDLVSREQYDYLYEPKDSHKFNVPKLKANFSRRMRNQGVLAFRFVDQIDGKPLDVGSEWLGEELIFYESRELENPKVLRARGVKVIASGFPDLFPVSPGVHQQLLETWRAPWESKATDIRGQHQLQAVKVINQARAQAQHDMARSLARIMQSSRSDEALAMRVFQALEATAIDSDTRQFLPRDTMYLLRSFKQWFFPGAPNQPNQMGEFENPDDRPLLDM